MKKLVLLILLGTSLHVVFSQEYSPKLNISLETGVRYTPFDYIGGGIMGVKFSYDKFAFSLRNDFNFSIAKVGTSSYFGLTDYRVLNYFNLHYLINDKFDASIGYGWISTKHEIYRLNSNYGYSALSMGMRYLASSRIHFELRGDIPFIRQVNNPVDLNIAFPVSLGIIYTIK
jgi:hypothetical protein